MIYVRGEKKRYAGLSLLTRIIAQRAPYATVGRHASRVRHRRDAANIFYGQGSERNSLCLQLLSARRDVRRLVRTKTTRVEFPVQHNPIGSHALSLSPQ